MIHLVTSDNRARYADAMDQYFKLRHDIYVVERQWRGLTSSEGREIDDYDDDDSSYFLAIEDGRVTGASRIRPSTKPHMLETVCPQLADVRGTVGLVDDDPHVFATTLVENVRLARVVNTRLSADARMIKARAAKTRHGRGSRGSRPSARRSSAWRTALRCSRRTAARRSSTTATRSAFRARAIRTTAG